MSFVFIKYLKMDTLSKKLRLQLFIKLIFT